MDSDSFGLLAKHRHYAHLATRLAILSEIASVLNSYERDMEHLSKCHNHMAFTAWAALGYTYAIRAQHSTDFGVGCSV